MPVDDEEPVLPSAVGRWLLIFAVAYGLLHHQGFVLARLGQVADSGTRWADWIDLATPYLVLVPASAALVRLRPGVSSRLWIVFALGAVSYVEGHGIHLAANSVSNLVADEAIADRRLLDVVHLWDELVGHYLWYGGLSVVVASVVLAIRPYHLAPVPVAAAIAVLASLLVGVTYATNALEGHFAWPGLAFSVAMTAGLSGDRWTRRNGLARRPERMAVDLALPGFVTAVLVLGFYGCWHRGFPDPSSVGWNLLAR